MDPNTVLGYTFRADNYSPAGVCEVLTTIFPDWILDASDTEAVLDDLANFLGYDREDETSFDTYDFPKRVFASQVTPDDFFLDDDGSYLSFDEL